MTACKFCGGKKRIPKTSYATRQEIERDPYCSRKCCEADHGISHKKGSTAMDYGVVA